MLLELRSRELRYWKDKMEMFKQQYDSVLEEIPKLHRLQVKNIKLSRESSQLILDNKS